MEHRRTAVAIIRKGEQFLVLHRSPTRKSMPNRWQFVAGHIEKGETPTQTVVRETMEETHLTINVVKEGTPYEVYEELTDCVWEVTPVLCEYVRGKVVIDAEHTEFEWATIARLKELKMVRASLLQLRQFGYKVGKVWSETMKKSVHYKTISTKGSSNKAKDVIFGTIRQGDAA